MMVENNYAHCLTYIFHDVFKNGENLPNTSFTWPRKNCNNKLFIGFSYAIMAAVNAFVPSADLAVHADPTSYVVKKERVET